MSKSEPPRVDLHHVRGLIAQGSIDELAQLAMDRWHPSRLKNLKPDLIDALLLLFFPTAEGIADFVLARIEMRGPIGMALEGLRAWLFDGDSRRAISLLDDAYGNESDTLHRALIERLIGIICLKAQHFDEAGLALNKAKALLPAGTDNAFIEVYLGMNEVLSGKATIARGRLQRLADHESSFVAAQAVHGLALCALTDGAIDEARKSAVRAFNLRDRRNPSGDARIASWLDADFMDMAALYAYLTYQADFEDAVGKLAAAVSAHDKMLRSLSQLRSATAERKEQGLPASSIRARLLLGLLLTKDTCKRFCSPGYVNDRLLQLLKNDPRRRRSEWVRPLSRFYLLSVAIGGHAEVICAQYELTGLNRPDVETHLLSVAAIRYCILLYACVLSAYYRELRQRQWDGVSRLKQSVLEAQRLSDAGFLYITRCVYAQALRVVGEAVWQRVLQQAQGGGVLPCLPLDLMLDLKIWGDFE